MRIVHTESSLGWGGQEIRILHEARGLVARGHRVELLAAPGARILAEAPRFGVSARALPIDRKSLAGLSALRAWLRASAREERIDVVNTHSSTDSWLAALACLGWKEAPALVRTRHISAPVPQNLATRWLYTRASRFVVTTGEALREALIGANGLDPARILSIPTGIDLEQFHPASPSERQRARSRIEVDQSVFVVGIVATLRSWKGHRYLIEALRTLAPRYGARLLLLIVGDGPQRAGLEGQVAAAHLDTCVYFAGNQDNVLPWLHAMDAFALPSYANEGVPQAVLQAMAAGVPVVTTAAGAIGEVAVDGQTALVVPVRDAAALAAALQRLHDEPLLRTQLAARARERVVARHGVVAMLDGMEGVFRKAVAA